MGCIGSIEALEVINDGKGIPWGKLQAVTLAKGCVEPGPTPIGAPYSRKQISPKKHIELALKSGHRQL